MSNTIAISAVTGTLCDLLSAVSLDGPLSDATVTAKALDAARAAGATNNQLNLFLYQTVHNAAWRNMDLPRKTGPGEVGQPPLALNLHYLLTAYGGSDDDLLTHRLMGRALSLLHDKAILTTQMLQATTANHPTQLAGQDLYLQVEGVRITHQPLSLEEVSKLWTLFQVKYRLSVALQVSVVLIESTRPTRTALPVLRRGALDQGVQVQAGFALPYPALDAVTPPSKQPTAQLGPAGQAGDAITLTGSNLTGMGVTVALVHPRKTNTITTFSVDSAEQLVFALPDNATDWPAGAYLVQVSRQDPGAGAGDPVRTSNTVPLLLSPRMVSFTPNTTDHATITTITVACRPQVWAGQRVSLLVGDREFAAPSPAAITGSIVFDVDSLTAGFHSVRLRVDGVDSLLVNYAATPPVFFANQQLELT